MLGSAAKHQTAMFAGSQVRRFASPQDRRFGDLQTKTELQVEFTKTSTFNMGISVLYKFFKKLPKNHNSILGFSQRLAYGWGVLSTPGDRGRRALSPGPLKNA